MAARGVSFTGVISLLFSVLFGVSGVADVEPSSSSPEPDGRLLIERCEQAVHAFRMAVETVTKRVLFLEARQQVASAVCASGRLKLDGLERWKSWR